MKNEILQAIKYGMRFRITDVRAENSFKPN
jgi:hypothetical protein